jgi:acetolactate synthase-1/3 small subunit
MDDKSSAAVPVRRSAHGHPIVDHAAGPGTAVIELRVRNHPGAMSHITGLFARRAFNLEAIFCAPREDDDGATSRMLLLVASEPRLEQVERQLLRLHDVVEVRHRTDLDRAFFARFVDAVPPREAAAVPL